MQRIEDEIKSTDESSRMFRALKSLKASVPSPTVSVFNENGRFAGNDQKKCKILKSSYEAKLRDNSSHANIQYFTGKPKPLNLPIRVEEVKKSARNLSNGSACGPDNIANEFIKKCKPGFLGTFCRNYH